MPVFTNGASDLPPFLSKKVLKPFITAKISAPVFSSYDEAVKAFVPKFGDGLSSDIADLIGKINIKERELKRRKTGKTGKSTLEIEILRLKNNVIYLLNK